MSGDGQKLLDIINASRIYLYNGGGPLLADGTLSGMAMDLPRSLQGKGRTNSVAITSTTAGDLSITFSSPPLTLDANTQIRLHTSGYGIIEVVYVDSSYLPSVSTTVFPLRHPIVY